MHSMKENALHDLVELGEGLMRHWLKGELSASTVNYIYLYIENLKEYTKTVKMHEKIHKVNITQS